MKNSPLTSLDSRILWLVLLVVEWPSPCHSQCQLSKLFPADVAERDQFGSHIAMHGSKAVFGVPFHNHPDGAVYVYRLQGIEWIQEEKISVGEGEGTMFGSSVAMQEDMIAVGAYLHKRQGAVYVFRRSVDGWIQETLLEASDASIRDDFGTSVALCGDVLAIGARGDDTGEENAGAVYVFRRDGEAWRQEQKLTSDQPTRLGAFGIALALTHDRIAAFERIREPSNNAGSVVVFRFDGEQWTQEQRLQSSDVDESDAFGLDLAMNEDWLVAGAGGDDEAGFNTGAVYFFRRTEIGVWEEFEKVVPHDPIVDHDFGLGIALHGNIVLVAAEKDDSQARQAGAVYVYRFDGSRWGFLHKLTATDATFADSLGKQVAFNGEIALLGASEDFRCADWRCNQGAVYSFAIAGEDCDENEILDVCDIIRGDPEKLDSDANGALDVCESGRWVPGDCVRDGLLDLSDAICILEGLFLRSPSGFPCGTGEHDDPANVSLLDWQPDGEVDVSDAIALAGFVFLGARPHILASPEGCISILDCPATECP